MDEKRLKGVGRKLLVAIYCLLLFQFTYPLTAAYASTLAAVTSVVFDFEQHIPFIPWMILPYMSSGLFFCIIPFYCQQEGQLLRYAKRFTFITLFAALCFLLFPLRFSFERPIVENHLLAIFFSFLKQYDSPFNQAPSLHVAYACLFWSVLRGQFSGWKKRALGVWLLLLGVGTLTVYQHHVIDVLTALILVQVSFMLFPNREEIGNHQQRGFGETFGPLNASDDESKNRKQRQSALKSGRKETKRNLQLANSYYLIGWLCVLVALCCERYVLPVIVCAWVAFVCFAVGYNYQRGNALFLKDRSGKIPLIKKVFYAPYQFAYWLIWRFFSKRNNPPMMEVLPRCYVGPRLKTSELVALGLDRNLVVFDLAAELEEVKLLGSMQKYHSFPLLDIAEIDVQDARVTVAALVSAYRALEAPENMIIHCTMGYSRSMIFAVLMIQELLSLDLNKAIDRVRSINRHLRLHDHAMRLMKIIDGGKQG